MTKKELQDKIDQLTSKIQEQTKSLTNLNEQNNNLQNSTNKLQTSQELLKIENRKLQQTILQNQFKQTQNNALNWTNQLANTNVLNQNTLSTTMNIGIFQSLADGVVGANWIAYIYFLRIAEIFKNRVVFKNGPDNLLAILYNAVYYGSMNGQIAIIANKERTQFRLAYVITTEYDEWGNLTQLETQTFNYFNTTKFNSKHERWTTPEELSNIVIYRFNQENFGLWVLAWPFVTEIIRLLNIYKTQFTMFSKRIMLVDDANNPNILSQQLTSFLNDSPIVIATDPNTIKKVEMDRPDMLLILNSLDNYQRWFYFNILGLRSKDITSPQSRDIAANQLTFNQELDKNSQSYDYYIELLLKDIQQKWNINVQFENRDIDITLSLGEQFTENKINDNGGDNE